MSTHCSTTTDKLDSSTEASTTTSEKASSEQTNSTPDNTQKTKYSTSGSIDADSTPDAYTKDISADEFVEDDPPSNETSPSEPTTEASGSKYGDLIDSGQIQAIENRPHQENPNNPEPDLKVKGNYHSENRFFERADPEHDVDMPNSLQQAWKEGVRVGIEHFSKEQFYDYRFARYHEPTNIIMLIDKDGMIETVITKFDTVIELTTDHLLRCNDPDCGRLYHKQQGDECCHWCGYHNGDGRNKTAAELLPQREVTQ